MKNLLHSRAVRRNAPSNILESSRHQLSAASSLRRHLRHIKNLLDSQENYVEMLAALHPFSTQFPCEHPELARERAVLQGMQMIAKNLIK